MSKSTLGCYPGRTERMHFGIRQERLNYSAFTAAALAKIDRRRFLRTHFTICVL